MKGAIAPKFPPPLLKDNTFANELDDIGCVPYPPDVIFSDHVYSVAQAKRWQPAQTQAIISIYSSQKPTTEYTLTPVCFMRLLQSLQNAIL